MQKFLPTPGRAQGRSEVRDPQPGWSITNDRDATEVVRCWALGFSCVEIARRLERSIGFVYDVLASPEGREAGADINKSLDSHVADAREQIARASPGAVDRLVSASSQDENLPWAVRAADSILDRAGLPRATRVQGAFLNINIPVSVAEALKAEAETVNQGASPSDGATGNAQRDGPS